MNHLSIYIFYLNDLIKSDSFFWFCALAGSGMCGIQALINLFSHIDFGLDAELASDVNGNGELGEDVSSTQADAKKFKWLSIQTLAGFLMMFGWTALTCHKQFAFQNTTTIVIALVIGSATAFLCHFISRLAKKLVSRGTVYNIKDALGKEAYIYQRIPKGGMGKISITLENLTHEINAISDHPEELPSFTRVKVLTQASDHTVLVTPL